MELINQLSILILPLLIGFIFIYALIKKTNMYEAFVDGVGLSPAGQRVDGNHGVVSADVEHALDVMRVHNLDQALVVLGLLAGELVAAGAECRGRGLLEDLDLMAGQVGQIEELVGEHALDTVDAAVDAVEVGVELVCADDTRQAGVDDGGGATGLCDEAVPHGVSLVLRSDTVYFPTFAIVFRESRTTRTALLQKVSRGGAMQSPQYGGLKKAATVR